MEDSFLRRSLRKLVNLQGIRRWGTVLSNEEAAVVHFDLLTPELVVEKKTDTRHDR